MSGWLKRPAAGDLRWCTPAQRKGQTFPAQSGPRVWKRCQEPATAGHLEHFAAWNHLSSHLHLLTVADKGTIKGVCLCVRRTPEPIYGQVKDFK